MKYMNHVKSGLLAMAFACAGICFTGCEDDVVIIAERKAAQAAQVHLPLAVQLCGQFRSPGIELRQRLRVGHIHAPRYGVGYQSVVVGYRRIEHYFCARREYHGSLPVETSRAAAGNECAQ